jgi:site-specific DNA-methyltransferase (adenine-specific)
MKQIPDKSIDLVLTDPPYGNMNTDGGRKLGISGWDIVIEPKVIMEIARKVLRKNGKMVLFSQEPYTTQLINSATKDIVFCYRAIWEKDNFAIALGSYKNMVSYFEDILIFSKNFESERNDDNPCKEYAIKVFEHINSPMSVLKEKYGNLLTHFYSSGKQFRLCPEETYNNLIRDFNIDKMPNFIPYVELSKMNKDYKKDFLRTFNLWEGGKCKSNILKYKKDYNGFHPTQKPIRLIDDLIQTFSNKKDLVLDLTSGSGTTCVSAKRLERNFIGIEISQKYCDIANQRLRQNILL